MKKVFKKNKPQKNDVYIGCLCYVEESGKMRNVCFLTDVVVQFKDGKYVNYFNNEEVYNLDFKNDGDVFFNPFEYVSLTDEEIYSRLLYNYNYCKDLADLIKKRMNADNYKVTYSEHQKMMRSLEQEKLCRGRYEEKMQKSKVKQKIR